jgi:DNA polymerase III gamma/tau subunit
MSTNLPDPIHWQPRRWEDAVGCEEVIARYKELVQGVRIRGLRSGFNTLVTGEPRTGKTCLTRFAIRCLYCQELDPLTLDPCPGTCSVCRENPEGYGLEGFQTHGSILDQAGGKTPIDVHYIPVDCTADLTPRMVEDKVLSVTRRTQFGMKVLVIVYFDEVHDLSKKGLDAMMLKPLEDHTVIWLATTAYAKEPIPGRSKTLNKMFLERFEIFRTKNPSVPSLTAFIYHRCHDYGITVEDPVKEVLTRLAERSGQSHHRAMKLVSRVWKQPVDQRHLTRQMVEDFSFKFEEV